MKINNIHDWNSNIKDARALQLRLSGKVRRAPLSMKSVEYVAGADIAVSKSLDMLIAAVVIVTFSSFEVVETRSAAAAITIPYVPGLLSFREIPVLLKAFQKVKSPFQVLLCDGQGIAHPRKLGLASHLGLFLGKPTVGCAKSRLVGEHAEVGITRGSFAALIYKGRHVGSVLRTRSGVKPIFVSPGHLMDIACSRRIALACSKGYRIPEPTRLAHILAEKKKRMVEAKRLPPLR
jgi:deoxyribonuclease V